MRAPHGLRMNLVSSVRRTKGRNMHLPKHFSIMVAMNPIRLFTIVTRGQKNQSEHPLAPIKPPRKSSRYKIATKDEASKEEDSKASESNVSEEVDDKNTRDSASKTSMNPKTGDDSGNGRLRFKGSKGINTRQFDKNATGAVGSG